MCPLWSCAWNAGNKCQFFVGTDTGKVLLYYDQKAQRTRRLLAGYQYVNIRPNMLLDLPSSHSGKILFLRLIIVHCYKICCLVWWQLSREEVSLFSVCSRTRCVFHEFCKHCLWSGSTAEGRAVRGDTSAYILVVHLLANMGGVDSVSSPNKPIRLSSSWL